MFKSSNIHNFFKPYGEYSLALVGDSIIFMYLVDLHYAYCCYRFLHLENDLDIHKKQIHNLKVIIVKHYTLTSSSNSRQINAVRHRR